MKVKHSSKIPYKTKRGQSGAVIIKPKAQDIFDMPAHGLKKFIQGIVWRDEHFNGAFIKDIAVRENCSDRHVRKLIMRSFEILTTA